MTGYKAANPVRAFDRAYINGQFVTPHGTQIVDLVPGIKGSRHEAHDANVVGADFLIDGGVSAISAVGA
jgi:hypothetical protein